MTSDSPFPCTWSFARRLREPPCGTGLPSSRPQLNIEVRRDLGTSKFHMTVMTDSSRQSTTALVPCTLRLHRGRTGPLPSILCLVQHPASALRYRLHDAAGRPLPPRPSPARRPPNNPGRGLPRLPQAVQGSSSNAPRAANSSLDQPATIADRQTGSGASLHSKFMTIGAAKSLTCSEARRVPAR